MTQWKAKYFLFGKNATEPTRIVRFGAKLSVDVSYFFWAQRAFASLTISTNVQKLDFFF